MWWYNQLMITKEKEQGALTMGYAIAIKIREHIATGKYSLSAKLPPERELCKIFQVSRPPIRSALAILQKDGLVTKFPRRGTIVTEKARKLVSNSVDKHSLVFVRFNRDVFTTHIAEGISQFLALNNNEFIIIDAHRSHERYIDAITNPPNGCKGLLVIPFNHEDYMKAVRQAYEAGLKIVFLDRILPSAEVSSVCVDNFAGAYQATSHLLELYQSQVYYIGIKGDPSSAHDRYLGWQEAMLAHGFSDLTQYHIPLKTPEYESSTHPNNCLDEVISVCKSLFQGSVSKRHFFFTMNDFVTKGVCLAARDTGLRVGEDVFVVGFDDLPLCHLHKPMLSSVYSPHEKMGFEGAKLLYAEIENEQSRPVHKVLPVELRIRQSSAGL